MELLVVTDDLTGANDAGSAFASGGLHTEARRAGVDTDWSRPVDIGVVDVVE